MSKWTDIIASMRGQGPGLVVGALAALLVPFVSGWEGRETTAYLDAAQVPTICDGWTYAVEIGDTATPEECDQLLTIGLEIAAEAVARRVTVEMPDTRRAAMISFVYNVGETRFAASTLLRLLNAGQTRAACDQLLRWVYAGDPRRVYRGLERRRAAERELCLQGL